MKVNKITDKIIHIVYPTGKEMCDVHMRFQEHYESPRDEFRNRPFTLGEFKDWYARRQGGFTYATDWAGMNMPSYILKPFKDGLFDPLTPEEEKLLELFKHRSDDFYIIATNEEDRAESLDHEICHGLFYTVPKYREAVLKALREYPKKAFESIRQFLIKAGYAETVMDDEIHAYISADVKFLKEAGVTFPMELHKKLRKIKERYYKETEG